VQLNFRALRSPGFANRWVALRQAFDRHVPYRTSEKMFCSVLLVLVLVGNAQAQFIGFASLEAAAEPLRPFRIIIMTVNHEIGNN